MKSTLQWLKGRYGTTGHRTYKVRIDLLSVQLQKQIIVYSQAINADQPDLFGVPYIIAANSNSHVSQIFNKDSQ
jgi:hypothetical protein